MAGNAVAFLKSYSLSNFPTPEQIITVQESDTIASALKTLSANDILCAPVLSDDGSCVGIIDMSAILRTILHPLANVRDKRTVLEDIPALDVTIQKPIKSQPSLYLQEDMELVSHKGSLLDACKLLGTMNVHRVVVVDDDNNIVNLITQSAVVRVLAENLSKLQPVVAKTLREIRLATPSTIVSCPANCSTIDAFEHMSKHDVSAMPVLDDENRILGNVSVRSLRDLINNAASYRTLKRPVTEFLTTVVPDTMRDEMVPAIACKTSTTMDIVIQRMSISRIHRIYVEDDGGNLLRVVSLSDVLAALVTPDAS